MPAIGRRAAGSASGFGLFGGGPVIVTISANTTNYNLFSAVGSPASAKKYIVNINAGVTIGGTGGTAAFTVGQFPNGTDITINNSGTIVGTGGSAGTSGVGGNGGNAINANYANQTVVINNLVGAAIYGGGGGGGKGGTGGGGIYQSGVTHLGGGDQSSSCDNGCISRYGSTAYCFGSCNYFPKSAQKYQCGDCAQPAYTTTSGGAGGNGGVGAGYSQSATSGSAGSAGGTNAGTGGTGGAGGAYGTAGSTGSTGANGNNGSGVAGSAGGARGNYLVKGSNSVTLNNSGTVAGGLA